MSLEGGITGSMRHIAHFPVRPGLSDEEVGPSSHPPGATRPAKSGRRLRRWMAVALILLVLQQGAGWVQFAGASVPVRGRTSPNGDTFQPKITHGQPVAPSVFNGNVRDLP